MRSWFEGSCLGRCDSDLLSLVIEKVHLEGLYMRGMERLSKGRDGLSVITSMTL